MEINIAEKYVPTAKQDEAHRCLARYILFGGAIGGGKSVWGGMDGLQLSYDFPGNVGLICRWELNALRHTTLAEFFDMCPDNAIVNHNKAEGMIYLAGGSRIMYMGLRPSSAFVAMTRLRSLNLGWFFVDECNEVPKPYIDVLKTRLRHRLPDGTYPRFRGLFACNPNQDWPRGEFIDHTDEDHKFIPALPDDNPHLPPGYIDQLIKDLPEELKAALIKGNWDAWQDEGYIFPYSWVKAAVERKLEPGEPKEAGVDLGAGGDESVGAIRRGSVVRIPYISRHKNTMQTVGELATLLDEEKPEIARLDAVGIGKGIYDRLKEQKYDVVPIIAGERAQHPERFVNRKAEDHWGFRMRLEEELADLPDDPVLISQLVGIKYEIQSDKRIMVESKKKRAARSLKSPDRAEAIINAFAADKKKRKWRMAS